MKAFQIHQSLTEPEKFFFYEVFRDEAAFADHQQTEHFKTLIAGQALPRLARRERTQHRFVCDGPAVIPSAAPALSEAEGRDLYGSKGPSLRSG